MLKLIAVFGLTQISQPKRNKHAKGHEIKRRDIPKWQDRRFITSCVRPLVTF